MPCAAAEGDKNAQTMVKEAAIEAGKEVAGEAADVASNIALAADATALALVASDPPAAAVAGTTGFVADWIAFGLSVLSGDVDRIKASAISVGINVIPGKISPKLDPKWQFTAKRYFNPNSKRFVKTGEGKLVTGATAAASIVADMSGNAQKENK
jgi:hypothetical protein